MTKFANFENCSKLRTAVCSSNTSSTSLKLCQNRFFEDCQHFLFPPASSVLGFLALLKLIVGPGSLAPVLRNSRNLVPGFPEPLCPFIPIIFAIAPFHSPPVPFHSLEFYYCAISLSFCALSFLSCRFIFLLCPFTFPLL